MEHVKYIARRRARFKSTSGWVNLPWGTQAEAVNGFIFVGGKALCRVTSQNAYDYFSQDDDGRGQERGALVTAILASLLREEPSREYQSRWDKVWADPLCRKYKRADHEDHWLWNYDFYGAPIADLQHIAGLVGARPAGRLPF